VSCAKTAEPIEMSFGLWKTMSPRNHILDGVQIPMGMDNFEGKVTAHSKVEGLSAVSGAKRVCLKTARCHKTPHTAAICLFLRNTHVLSHIIHMLMYE